MAEIVNAIDKYQIGENGHVEYAWSDSVQEKILQFSFQLTRTDEEGVKRLQSILKDILTNLKHTIENGPIYEKEIAKGHLSLLYRIIGHTRDIINGKGECTLTYMMIYTWYYFYPELATFALKCLVDLGDKKVHQYGSWKDIKYFCEYCKCQGEKVDSYLIQFAIKLINSQINKDYSSYIAGEKNISLAAKWVPREKSSFGWLYHALATDYFSEFVNTANIDIQMIRAVLKCKTEYRKILSKLNKHLDTLQIKQCDNNWCSIDFNNVTSISLSKQKKAFLNIKKNGELRCPDISNRIECSSNFNNFIQNSIHDEINLKGKRIGMIDFTRQALELLHSKNKSEIDLLNSQWRDNSTQNEKLGKMIPMVDVSGSMDGTPMNAAIALGIRISEKSVLGKRIMTFSANPSWINLKGFDDFVSQVEIIKNAVWGMNTNFYKAFDMILDAIIQNKMKPEDVKDLILVILSDMQMDASDGCDKKALYDFMKIKYEVAGIRVHGKPYKPPYILFWNLRSTTGFPILSNQPNCSMISGFSPVLLNDFCDKGLDALRECTPWSTLVRVLEAERYKIMSNKIFQEM